MLIELAQEGNGAIDKIAQIVQQLRIVLGLKVNPLELGVLDLGPHIEQVKAPHVRGDARLLRLIAKDADAA